MATINLITGINGSGKTLRLLPTVEKLRKESITEESPEGRPVFYYAIPGIKEAGVLTGWTEIEPFDRQKDLKGMNSPMKLWELPQGSIIVIDEAHRTFPRRGQNSPVPQHVQQFDMARHNGYEFYLCTQDVKDLDPFVRSRIGFHEHCIRVFGMERSTVWRWQKQGDPGSTKSSAEAEKIEFSYPKEVYTWYRSADTHVVKKTIPYRKLIILAACLLAIPALLIYAFYRVSDLGSFEEKQKATMPAKNPEQVQHVAEAAKAKKDGATWAAQFAERVDGIAYSAPFYDDELKARTMPRIAGCMRIQISKVDKCTCNSQQGSTLTTITHDACVFYVRNGWFDPTAPDERDIIDRGRSTPSTVAPAATMLTAVGG